MSDPRQLLREKEIYGVLRPEMRSYFLEQVGLGVLPPPIFIGCKLRCWQRFEILQSLALDVAVSRWPGDELDTWVSHYVAQQKEEFGEEPGQWFHARRQWLQERNANRPLRVVTQSSRERNKARAGAA